MADWGGYPKIYRDVLGRAVFLESDRWRHAIDRHPEMQEHESLVGEVLRAPELVRRSRHEQTVLVYYRFYGTLFGGKYVAVVMREEGRHGAVLTAYVTDAIKRGETVWRRD